jgi:hypothetical protein
MKNQPTKRRRVIDMAYDNRPLSPRLFESQVELERACVELCKGVKGARPSHPKLLNDLSNFEFCVGKSPTLAAAVTRFVEQLAAAPPAGEPNR